jgi:predicted aspartyl protease
MVSTMGAFSVSFEVADFDEQPQWLTLEGLVDSGSTYTWVPRDKLESINLNPRMQRMFKTADGRSLVRDMAVVMLRLEGQTLPSLVVFADPDDAVLLGVVTLEEFGLGVDPVNRTLVPVPGLAMGWRALP